MDYFKSFPLPDWTSNFESRKTTISQLPYEEYMGSMEQGADDTNSYRLIRLPNNMVVLCVHNDSASGDSAVLSANVGSNMDPVELPGLTMLLVHLMSKRLLTYSPDSDYPIAIQQMGRRRQCLAAYYISNFCINVYGDTLEDDLGQVASAFINLPFDKEFFTNELNEVDSDQMKVQSNNLWRDFQLAGKFAELDHSNAEFMQWCIAALKSSAKTHGLDLYDELLKYYTMYYSSDIMKLAVHGKRSLDQMVEWTVAKFSAIKSKGNSVQIRSTHPVSSEFLGSDSSGSIMSYLRQRGWATDIDAQIPKVNGGRLREFSIIVHVTHEGVEHYADIVQAVFAYIDMLIKAGPQEQAVYETAIMLKIKFNHAPEPNWNARILRCAESMHNEYMAPEHILSTGDLFEKPNYDDILHCLNYLNSSNCYVLVGAPQHDSVDCSESESYFDTAYHEASLPISLTSKELNNCILEKLAAFSVDTEQFAAYKKEYVEKSSFDHPAQPDKHCLHNLSCITEQSTWHYKILEDEIDKVTPVMLQEHVNSLFKGAHTKMTVIGNFYENDALKAADTVQAVIGPHKTIEDKIVACLKSVVKSDLLEFWDKHINPNTAPGYMRVDSQMWSSGTWYPSASDMAKYSARTLALYGCMHDEGNTELDIAMVDKFISNTAAELLENPGINISADDLVGKLKGACLSEYGARYISGSDKEKSKNTKDALQIAINDYESPFVNRALCNADIVDSGAVITPDGVCLLTDYAKFQSTQKLHDLVRPVNMPEPKYSC
ncbi:metalloprotease [Coemansia thaxteri]|uniref:Metalloprotease n=1 Tax=Coemansia thaxteri TaxID=2663907 RepID=A0A9W8BH46_9FUNG|nr:metalloprotease [Coemansia thaxteri]